MSIVRISWPLRQPAGALQRGFTLLEIMIVIAIMGIVTTFAWLTIDTDSHAERLLVEARRFAAVVEQQRYEATLSGEIRGLVVTRDHYLVQRLAINGEWISQMEKWVFPNGIQISLAIEGNPARLAGVSSPQIVLTPSGEVSEFSLVFGDLSAAEVAVEGDLLGRIQLSSST